eukprot:5641574-Pyramimonas_sp.AAC.2
MFHRRHISTRGTASPARGCQPIPRPPPPEPELPTAGSRWRLAGGKWTQTTHTNNPPSIRLGRQPCQDSQTNIRKDIWRSNPKS